MCMTADKVWQEPKGKNLVGCEEKKSSITDVAPMWTFTRNIDDQITSRTAT